MPTPLRIKRIKSGICLKFPMVPFLFKISYQDNYVIKVINVFGEDNISSKAVLNICDVGFASDVDDVHAVFRQALGKELSNTINNDKNRITT